MKSQCKVYKEDGADAMKHKYMFGHHTGQVIRPEEQRDQVVIKTQSKESIRWPKSGKTRDRQNDHWLEWKKAD